MGETSQKERILSRLSEGRLLQLARLVSQTPIHAATSKEELINMIKGSLSIEEIKDQINWIENAPQSLVAPKGFGNELIIGGIGQVFLIVSTLVFNLGYYASSYQSGSLTPTQGIELLGFWGIVGSVFLITFAILFLASMLVGRWIFSGNRVGLASGVVAFVASMINMSFYVLTFFGMTYLPWYYIPGSYSLLGLVMVFLVSIFRGLAFVAVGAFFLVNYKRFPNGGLWMGTGILYMIAASNELSFQAIIYSYYPIGFISFMPMAIGALGASCLFTSKSGR